MNRRIRSRLGRVGLALTVAFTTLGPLAATPALADTLVATEVNAIDTAPWAPPTVDPSGIAYIGPHLLVTDMNAEPITQNAWEYTVTPPTVVSKLLGPVGLDEPTGVDYDSVNDRLFVSSDALNNNTIHAINNWSTSPVVVTTNVEAFSGDTEDPAFDPATNTLYFLDGGQQLVRKMAINPTTGAGTLDTTFFIDLSALAAGGDWEAMAWNAAQGTLIVAPNNQSDLLYEIPTTAGKPLQPNNIINVAGGSGILARVSGLGLGPTTGGGGNSYWMADRQSNGIFEFTTNALVPTAPIAYNRTISVPFNKAVAANMVATDSNNDTLTYTIVTPPASGTLNSVAPGGAARTYTPNPGFVGTDSYTFTASDGALTSNTATVTLNVQAANTAPVLASIPTPKTVNELDNITFKATATDTAGSELTFSILNAPAGATMTSTGIFNWRPSEAQGPGTYDITVRVTDSGGLFDSQVVRIIVNEVSGGGGGGGGTGAPGSPFVDDNGHIFENAITWLANKGITQGCNPPTNDRFCPDDPVTRGQMAVFLVRAFGYSDNGGGNLFVDDNGLFYENSADRLFTAGVTVGCNPPTNNRYCGERDVTRGQMAAFLARAFDLAPYNGPDRFVDDNGHLFEGAIERLAQAGITLGCNPPTNNRFCPDQAVTRGQMAAFLKRAFGE